MTVNHILPFYMTVNLILLYRRRYTLIGTVCKQTEHCSFSQVCFFINQLMLFKRTLIRTVIYPTLWKETVRCTDPILWNYVPVLGIKVK